MNSIKKTARLAGFLYFTYFITSVIANWFANFVFVDAPTKLNSIIAHESLFRVGLVISLFSVVFFLLAAWYLYVLLKPVNKKIALLFLLLNLGGFAIWCFSTLNLFASLLLLSGADYLKVFQPDQLQAQAMLFISLRKNGAVIAQIPYGIWLFPLGYLVFKSGFLPNILGILLIADGFGLLIYVFWNRWPRLTGMSTKGIKREMWSLRWNIATNPARALRPNVMKRSGIAVGEPGC